MRQCGGEATPSTCSGFGGLGVRVRRGDAEHVLQFATLNPKPETRNPKPLRLASADLHKVVRQTERTKP